ncbi:endo alpha-1,4 polygalactosaminidase [Gallaecimonas pentaromativorans]|uniref:Glycoside-hydrolase family GH114 TIM-barrel domain-containing protein n=1 Tax=Gallaecimonas pentaromativorans TaxID=584787 RepID=A0A3N1PKH9_9GAMM|nr:endo alpha-1,4 polygalactosaminidase [Gallaecimonas pentaromativorans]ROQ28619.1 hypothetical protein EDC28_103212 [Gallaecimonas pentaromativorans]
MRSTLVPLLLCSLLLCACGGGGGESTASTPQTPTTPTPDPQTPAPVTGDWYQPQVGDDWQIQLTGTVNTSYDVALYDIDLFDSSTALIQQLHQQGARVICYFSAGTFEDWREDASQFATDDYGYEVDGWPGEYWLDITSSTVQAVMQARLELAQTKGCDGVDPDNVDGYQHSTGFNLGYNDQLQYNRWLANSAHELGLSVGLKNDLNQVTDLVDYMDFAINEQCFNYGECDYLTPFVNANKPVFNIEYNSQYVSDASARSELCQQAASAGLSTLVLPKKLNGNFRYSCQD